jgi:hypothetical protein
VVAGAAASLVCFAAGIAVGEAIEDGSAGDATATRERTLVPATVAPPPRISSTSTSSTTKR